MIRLSEIRNCPVVCGDKRLGVLQEIILDAAQKRVQALIVSCGLRGKRVVARSSIVCIADGFILADGFEKYRRSKEEARCCFVRDTLGRLSGYVSDYAIDRRTLNVFALEIVPGYLPCERRGRFWMYAYARTDAKSLELTIPALSEL